MAEKNTLSILESIKKKMQKLDQKSKKSEIVSDADSEFEYIAPASNSASDETKIPGENFSQIVMTNPSETENSASSSMFGDEFEEEMRGSEQSPQEAAEAGAKIQKDAATSAGKVALDPISMNNQDADFGAVDDVFLDEKDQADASYKMPSQNLSFQSDQPTLSKMPSFKQEDSKAPMQYPQTEYSDSSKKKEEVAKNLAPIDLPQEDDLDFSDLDIDEDQDNLPSVNSTAANSAPSDLGAIDDENNNEELPKEEEKVTQEADDLDLNFDEELDAVNNQADAAPEQVKTRPQNTVSDEIDDLNLDDLDLEEEEDTKTATSSATPAKAKTLTIDDLDDIDLEDLLKDENIGIQSSKKPEALNNKNVKEAARPSVKAQEEVPAIAERQGQESGDFEDADLDGELEEDLGEEIDLEEEEGEEEGDFAQHQEVEQKSTMAKSQNIDDEFDDVDLDEEMERMNLKSPYSQNKQTKQNSNPIVYGRKDDFENEEQSNLSIPTKSSSYSRRASLLSEGAMQETTQSIKKLIDAKNVINGIRSFSESSTLNELAIQIMEPKLDKWLNDNLPQLVEKIVQEEIKKIFMKERE